MKSGLIFLGSVLAVSAHAVIIDDFDTGAYNSGYVTSGTVHGWTAAASALGGIRYTKLTVTDNPLIGDARTRVLTGPNILEVSSDTDLDAEYWLGFGFANSDANVASNPLNTNFGLNPLIELNFRSNDQAQPVTVTLHTNGGANSYSRLLNIAGGITSVSPVTYTFDFSSDAALLGDVDGVTIYFDPQAGGDFALNSVNAVPEPASMIAIAVGAAAMIRRRKK